MGLVDNQVKHESYDLEQFYQIANSFLIKIGIPND